jgi:hypothetical protein
VANGPAYGDGFGLVTADEVRPMDDAQMLYGELATFVAR